MSLPDVHRSSSSKRALAGAVAGLALAAGSLAGAPAAHAAPAAAVPTAPVMAVSGGGAPIQAAGMRLVMCYYLPWMC